MRIIVIDDEETMLRIMERTLTPEGYAVESFAAAGPALARLRQGGAPVDLVITDLMMPGLDGFQVIDQLQALDREIMVLVITAYSSVESAVRAIRAGAYDFIPKPVDPDHLLLVVKRAARARSLTLENIGLRQRLQNIAPTVEMIGAGPAMRRVCLMIEKVRDSDGTVLIIGESGVGKELVARAIHGGGRRADKPFIAINCGALPDELLESELFGYERGAFTGAVARKIGLCEAAAGGALFLDEVSSISPMMQVKILRFLQERSFRRLGGQETLAVDARIIAATNEDLREAVERGAFRKDLYYRLNVLPLEVPPLRQRRDDIPLLLRHFIKKYAAKNDREIIGVRPEAEELLINAAWEGNVRELENVVERAVIISDDPWLGLDDLPADLLTAQSQERGQVPFAGAAGAPLNCLPLAEVEKRHIAQVLRAVAGNKSQAARLLGIDYSTLRRKLRHD